MINKLHSRLVISALGISSQRLAVQTCITDKKTSILTQETFNLSRNGNNAPYYKQKVIKIFNTLIHDNYRLTNVPDLRY